MKNIKKLLVMFLSIAFVMSFFGCTVNEEKLANQAVAKVNDTEILKSEMNKIVNFTSVYYYSTTGTDVTSDAESYQQMKEEIVDDMVEYELIKTVADKYDYKLDEKEIDEATQSTISSIKESTYMESDKYMDTLNKYGFSDEESFEEAVRLYNESALYTNGFMDQFRNKVQGKGYATSTFMKVGDLEVPSYVYYYVYIQKVMEEQYNSYVASSSSSEEQTQKTSEELREETIQTLEEKAAFYAQGEKNKTEVTSEEVENIKSQLSTYESMFDSTTLSSIYNAYGITEKQYDLGATWIAKADAYKTKLHETVSYKEPTEEEAKKEFESNKNQYDKSTVSAKHILTEDKDLAEEIYEQATKDGADFDELMSKYQQDESITEASDLGAFTYSQMVEDFSKAAFGAEKGEVVGPVETEYGYHVIYVYDKETVETTFESVKDTIISNIDSQRKTQAADEYDEDIVKQYKCEVIRTGIDEPFNMYMAQLKDENKIKIYNSIVKK